MPPATTTVTQTLSYSYNLDGSIATVTYPSTKVITYTASNAQRLTAAKDVANNIQFATAASYVPPGGLSALVTGQINGGFGGINESHNYNSSLEYTTTKATSTAGTAMDLSLSYNLSGGDNGTVTSVTNNADPGRTQNFSYDPLNRISSATTQATSGVDCWGQNFTPDALANLNTVSSAQCNSAPLSLTVDANNHIINDSTFAYDAVGNMTKDGTGAGYSYTFDDENHLTIATGFSGGPYCYVYDGNGLRVAKKSNSNSTCSIGTVVKLYWRSIAGGALAETDSTGSTTNSAYNEYVFFAGRRIASRNGTGTIFYYFADALGSTRTITTGSGTGQTPGQLCYDADFTPYGQEMQHTERLQTTACPPNYRFTGYEYDSETGLNYAFARYYSSRLGRFLSTDPLGGAIGDLQSHNAYAYVLNNPANLVDPMGLCTAKQFQNDTCPDGRSHFNDGFGGAGGCELNGGPVDCNFLGTLLASPGGYTAVCPNNNCSGLQLIRGPGGTSIFQQWIPGVIWTTGDDVTGYIIHQVIGGWKTVSTVSSSQWFTLLGFSNFFAGAGDCLTGRCIPFVHDSLTEWARRQNGADSVVNRDSGAYLGGEITGGTVGAGIATLAAANAAVGLETKVALHGAHHAFELLGGARLAHLQVILWIAGQKGSDISLRIPFPWK